MLQTRVRTLKWRNRWVYTHDNIIWIIIGYNNNISLYFKMYLTYTYFCSHALEAFKQMRLLYGSTYVGQWAWSQCLELSCPQQLRIFDAFTLLEIDSREPEEQIRHEPLYYSIVRLAACIMSLFWTKWPSVYCFYIRISSVLINYCKHCFIYRISLIFVTSYKTPSGMILFNCIDL
jgi:hypothetical protein